MQNKNYPKLKPCPFCGGEAAIYKNEIMKTFCVYCTSCYGKTAALFDKENDAVEAWNRRINENERLS